MVQVTNSTVMTGMKAFVFMVGKLMFWIFAAGIIHSGIANFYSSYCVPHGVMEHLMGWVTMGSPACMASTQLMSWGHQFACAWWVGAAGIVISSVKNMVSGSSVMMD